MHSTHTPLPTHVVTRQPSMCTLPELRNKSWGVLMLFPEPAEESKEYKPSIGPQTQLTFALNSGSVLQWGKQQLKHLLLSGSRCKVRAACAISGYIHTQITLCIAGKHSKRFRTGEGIRCHGVRGKRWVRSQCKRSFSYIARALWCPVSCSATFRRNTVESHSTITWGKRLCYVISHMSQWKQINMTSRPGTLRKQSDDL